MTRPMTEAHPEMTSGMLSGTSLYYTCIGYVLANFSTDSLGVNHTTRVQDSSTIATLGTFDPTSNTAETAGRNNHLREMLDACEAILQSLYSPTPDSRRYARELLTYLLMGVAGTTVGCFGLIGNLLSLVVLTRRSMRTSTYCYLAALAVCDLMTVFCMLVLLIKDTRKPEVARPTWPASDDVGLYPYLFPYLHPAAFTLQVSSVWLTLAFTVDRYIMICHPFRSEPFCTVRRARQVVAGLIVASIAFNLPKFFEYRTIVMPSSVGPSLSVGRRDTTEPLARQQHEFVYTDLTEFGRSRLFKELYHSWLYIVFVFALPFTALVVLNGFLAQVVRRSRQRSNELMQRSSLQATANVTSSSSLSRPVNNAKFPGRVTSCLLGLSIPPPVASNAGGPMSSSFSTASSSVCQPPLHQVSPVSKRIDTTIMLIGVVVIFIVCQFPALVSRALWAFEDDPSAAFTRLPMYALNEVANFLVLLNSSVNIIPYYFFGRRFRQQFLVIFCPRCVSSVPQSEDGGINLAEGRLDRSVNGRFELSAGPRKRDARIDSSAGYCQSLKKIRVAL